MCETSASVEYFLDGCLGKSSVCALSPLFPWLVLGEEMEVVRSHPHRDNLTSRTRCVWGNTVVPELPSPPQRARPFHSHSIQTPASPFSLFHRQRRADPSKSIPPFEGRPPCHHFGFLGGPSVPAFLHHRLVVGLLVLPIPWSKTRCSVTGTGSHRVSLPQGS